MRKLRKFLNIIIKIFEMSKNLIEELEKKVQPVNLFISKYTNLTNFEINLLNHIEKKHGVERAVSARQSLIPTIDN